MLPNLKNIYACLVHEQQDCVIDLVRNLRYHDPSSIILLYNGGNDQCLLKNDFFDNGPGVVVHPDAVPMQWGYLLWFAVHCMQYALEHFSFDTITVVDSDQLAVKSNYTQCLANFLSNKPSTGMLSSAPERVGETDGKNRVAAQAFKEYDLWKPFINSFEGGEDKFVHWTFWPSSVFTYDAVKDLVQMLNTNTLLQEILTKTKIWANEEVILPTLVRLMGYGIEKNPCSYDYIKYKVAHTVSDVRLALAGDECYWIHPVPRLFTDPVRSTIRNKFNGYNAGENRQPIPHLIQPAMLNS